MKKVISICLLVISISGFSQIYVGEKCKISFFSETALENIDAVNSVTKPVFNPKTGDFVIKAQQIAFVFKSAFMQEHYNENYVESSKFPKATFKGKILNFNASKLSTSKAVYDIEGDLTLHGVTKRIKAKVALL